MDVMVQLTLARVRRNLKFGGPEFGWQAKKACWKGSSKILLHGESWHDLPSPSESTAL